jgi:hypothetical protein
VTWTKLPAIDPIRHCNICPPRPRTIPLSALVHPGFGGAYIEKHGEDFDMALEMNATVRDAEDFAAGDPDHDWRLTIKAPLYTAVYQRQSEGEWVLVERGEGFA